MSLNTNINEKAALIWAIADKLTGGRNGLESVYI